jgi:hypothetical protein
MSFQTYSYVFKFIIVGDSSKYQPALCLTFRKEIIKADMNVNLIL